MLSTKQKITTQTVFMIVKHRVIKRQAFNTKRKITMNNGKFNLPLLSEPSKRDLWLCVTRETGKFTKVDVTSDVTMRPTGTTWRG